MNKWKNVNTFLEEYIYETLPMHKLLYSALFICLSFSACNIINPKEQVPTYLRLDPFVFSNPDSSFTGSTTYSIPSAWVYVCLLYTSRCV